MKNKPQETKAYPFGCQCMMIAGAPVVVLEMTPAVGDEETVFIFQEKGCGQLINALSRELKKLEEINESFYSTTQ